jgi:multidrug efflux pump subunit AcrA (membrane-fusion protein)
VADTVESLRAELEQAREESRALALANAEAQERAAAAQRQTALTLAEGLDRVAQSVGTTRAIRWVIEDQELLRARQLMRIRRPVRIVLVTDIRDDDGNKLDGQHQVVGSEHRVRIDDAIPSMDRLQLTLAHELVHCSAADRKDIDHASEYRRDPAHWEREADAIAEKAVRQYRLRVATEIR